MKKILAQRAFTLIELIVSSLLVVIVIMGIISINMVLTNNSQDYGQRYLVKSETQATLNHILNNAALAVGTSSINDEAILIGAAGVGDPNSFCIHQPGGVGNNLINNPLDIWLCYQWYPAGDPSFPYQIRWCAEQYTGPGLDPRGASSCSTSATIPPGGGPTFLGSAFSITNTAGTNLTTSPNFAASGSSQLLFSINILNCLDNTLPSCNTGSTPGTSSDPANNPEVQLSGSVIPLQTSS